MLEHAMFKRFAIGLIIFNMPIYLNFSTPYLLKLTSMIKYKSLQQTTGQPKILYHLQFRFITFKQYVMFLFTNNTRITSLETVLLYSLIKLDNYMILKLECITHLSTKCRLINRTN